MTSKPTVFTLLLCLLLGTSLTAQIKVTPWQIHEGNEGIITVANGGSLGGSGDPAAYQYASIPDPNDPNWEAAPLDAAGKVSIQRKSTLACRKEIDFLYFQTEVFIPENVQVSEFTMSYDKADDGARIYIFNSAHSDGAFDPMADLRGKVATVGAVNLVDKVRSGEVNRVVVVQYDDCAVYNNMIGIQIKVNGDAIAPTNDAIMDLCGNEYTTKSYGNQQWLQENLRAPACAACPALEYVELGNHPSQNGHFYTADKAAYAYYGNNAADADPVSGQPLGAMFTYAALQECNVCPEGYRVATADDYRTLLQTVQNDGNMLKNRDAANGNNPFMYIAGRADAYGSVGRGRFVKFWTSEEDPNDPGKGTAFTLAANGQTAIGPEDKRVAAYVRCVKSTAPELPAKFKLHAYSTHGDRGGEADHFMGWQSNTDPQWAKILTEADKEGFQVMEIEPVIADDVQDIVYLRVRNYGAGDGEYYLTVDPSDQGKIKIMSGQSVHAKFRVKRALQTEAPNSGYVSFESVNYPNHYLRHQGYRMFLHEATPMNMGNKVFVEDASWQFQSMAR